MAPRSPGYDYATEQLEFENLGEDCRPVFFNLVATAESSASLRCSWNPMQ